MNSRLKLPVEGIIQNIVYSKTEVWAYYILADKPFDFLSNEGQTKLANAIQTGLASLCRSSVNAVECHLLLSNQLFSVDSYKDQLKECYNRNGHGKNNDTYFQKYLQQIVNNLYLQKYQKRVTYLGIKLSGRGAFDFTKLNIFHVSYNDIYTAIKEGINSVFSLGAMELTNTEVKKFMALEKEIYRIIKNSSLAGERLTTEETLLLIKRRFYPSMPSCYLDVEHKERVGLSDIALETLGEIKVTPHFLKIRQFIDGDFAVGYRATLSVASIPKDLMFPSLTPPLFYNDSILPYTVSSKFLLMPTEKMKSELRNKRLELKDELKNLNESDVDTPLQTIDTSEKLSLLEQELNNSNLPWVQGGYRITIEGKSEEEIKDVITRLKTEYIKHDYDLVWTTGDQLQLFLEEMPCGKLANNDFCLTTNLGMLGTCGAMFGNSVGNEIRQINKTLSKQNLNTNKN